MSTLIKSKYNIELNKKAMINTLALEITAAQYVVDELQASIASLTEKSATYQNFLAMAETNRTNALNNKNKIEQLSQQVLDFKNTAESTFNEMVDTTVKTKTFATQVKSTLDKLIFSAELLNKLSALVTKQKASNPLISNDLVNSLTIACAQANTTLALTFVALTSTCTTQASAIQAEASLSLEYSQTMALYESITGKNALQNDELNAANAIAQNKSLTPLFYNAYNEATNYYEQMQTANTSGNLQVTNAHTQLNNAVIKLQSLQAAYVAANAAVMS